jgi:hypothetical protein
MQDRSMSSFRTQIMRYILLIQSFLATAYNPSQLLIYPRVFVMIDIYTGPYTATPMMERVMVVAICHGTYPIGLSSLAFFLYLDWSLDLTTTIILVLYCLTTRLLLAVLIFWHCAVAERRHLGTAGQIAETGIPTSKKHFYRVRTNQEILRLLTLTTSITCTTDSWVLRFLANYSWAYCSSSNSSSNSSSSFNSNELFRASAGLSSSISSCTDFIRATAMQHPSPG